MTEKNKKRAIIATMVAAFIFAIWWLAHHKKSDSVAQNTPDVDAQDSYYLTGNQVPAINMPSVGSVQPSHIDLGNTTNNLGASQAQLDALGDRICGCMNPCAGTQATYNGAGAMFDASLDIPTLPSYMQQYVAPTIPTLDFTMPQVSSPSSQAPSQNVSVKRDTSYLIYKNNPYNVNIQTDEIFAEDAKRNRDMLEAAQMKWMM